MTTAYAPDLDRFLRPARARPQIWRMLLGLLVIGTVYAGLIALAALGYGLWRGSTALIAAMAVLTDAATPGAVLAILFSFLPMAAGVALAVRLVHRRTVGSLFGRGPRVLRDFGRAVLAVALAYSPGLVLWSVLYDAEPGVLLATWVMLLPLSLLGLALQTGAEELVFRGYILQALAARFRSPLVWALLPSLAFGALHYDPARMGEMAIYAVGATALFGLAAADLTARTGSLGAAWGMHFANNTVAILFLGTPGSIPGLALWLTPYSAADLAEAGALPVLDAVTLIAAWALARRLCTR